MVFSLARTPLVLALLAACGPGTDTTDNSTDSTTAATGTTAGPGTTTDTPTTGTPTTDATTVNPTTVTTTDATTVNPTTDATTGGAVCPDEFPQDGTPCTDEGLFCGGPCEDPCAFCNVIKCENGTWMGLEVFPADCPDCPTVCGFVVPAACPGGPPDQDSCVAGCMDVQAGDCGLLYNQALACTGSMPTFTCSESGQPIVESCADQYDALYACLG